MAILPSPTFGHSSRLAIGLEQKTLQIIDNPSGTRVSPMSHVHFVTLVSGSDTGGNGGEGVRLSPVRHSSWLFHIVNISTYFIGNISK